MKSVQKPQSILKWMRYFMILCGQWVFQEKVSIFYNINKFWIYFFFAEIHLYFSPIFTMWQCKSNVIEMISNYLRLFGYLLVTTILKYNGMMDSMRKIDSYEKNELPHETSEVRRIYEKHAWIMNLIAKGSVILSLMAVANWYILGVIIKVEISEECPLKQGLLFQLSYPFEVENHMWAVRLVETSLLGSAGVFIPYSKLPPTCLLLYVLAHIKMLKEHIRTFDKTVDSIKDSYNSKVNEVRLMALKVIFKKHQELIRLSEQVQKISGVVVMVNFISEPIALASYLIAFLTTDDVLLKAKLTFPCLLVLSQLYIFSSLATEIIEESMSISHEIYNKTDWRNYEINEQKFLIIMMARAQRPLTITMPVIGDTSLETFKTILKMCCSIQRFVTAVRVDQ